MLSLPSGDSKAKIPKSSFPLKTSLVIIRRIINLHLVCPQLLDLFTENRLSFEVQRNMFDAEPALYTSLFYERGSAQPIHRDTPYFVTWPEYFYLGVWVALEDTDENNGALQVVRGAQKLPELDRRSIALKHFSDLSLIKSDSHELWDEYQGALRAQFEAAGLRVDSLFVRKGDTIIWHPQAPHGGGPIGDIKRTRLSLVMHTTPVGVPVYQLKAFFNPEGEFSTKAPWRYARQNGCYYAEHAKFNIGHTKDFELTAVRQ